MKNLKLGVLALFLVFTVSTIKAQDKYEFAQVTWTGSDYQSKIYTAINGKDFTEEKVELTKEAKNLFNINPLFSKVNELQTKGWEIMSFNQHSLSSDVRVGVIYLAYLRRKL